MAVSGLVRFLCGALLVFSAVCFATEVHCDPLGSLTKPAESCLHLRNSVTGPKGPFSDGIYYISPKGSNGVPFPVFCDMHTAGGGWTLVAVVANGDDQHWTFDDRHGDDGQRTSNWEAETTIGEISYRTPFANEDYKSKAFYTVPAKAVLLTYKGENLARTTNSCLGGRNLRSLFNTYKFSCAGGSYNCRAGANKCIATGGSGTSSVCTHACDVAEQYRDDQDPGNQGIAAAGEDVMFVKTGEANGAQDRNKDRSYFSFKKARKNVDYPQGLGSFSRVSGVLRSNDIGISNDASIRPSDQSRFYGILVR